MTSVKDAARHGADNPPASDGQAAEKYVGLFGLFGMGNFGNDGSLEAMVNALRRSVPREKLLCICSIPEEVERSLGLEAAPIYHRPRHFASNRVVELIQKVFGKAITPLHALREVRRLKILIVPGMGALDDFLSSPFGWSLDLLIWCVAARVMGVPVAFASVGAGPIHHPLSRVFCRVAGRVARYRSYRDANSKAFASGLGIDVRQDPVTPDLVFQLPTPPNESTGQPPFTVGVGLMTYRGWTVGGEPGSGIYEEYVSKMTAFIAWLLGEGHRVRVMIGDISDATAVDDILAALRAQHSDLPVDTIAFAPVSGLGDLMQQMAGIDVAVVTRFHNVVCALKMGKPAISIGYQDKNDMVMQSVGLGEYCQHIERLDLQRLKEQTADLIARREALGHEILEATERFRESLKAQEAALAALISNA